MDRARRGAPRRCSCWPAKTSSRPSPFEVGDHRVARGIGDAPSTPWVEWSQSRWGQIQRVLEGPDARPWRGQRAPGPRGLLDAQSEGSRPGPRRRDHHLRGGPAGRRLHRGERGRRRPAALRRDRPARGRRGGVGPPRVVACLDMLLVARGVTGRPGESHADEPNELLSQVLAGAVAVPMPDRAPSGPAPIRAPTPPCGPPGTRASRSMPMWQAKRTNRRGDLVARARPAD
jgi:hypothetical protein